MEKFKIPINWMSFTEIIVKAESLDKAVEKIVLEPDSIFLSEKDCELVEGSIEVNYGLTEVSNPGHKLVEYEKEKNEWFLEARIRGHKIGEEFEREELEAKDFGIVDKEPQKVEEVCNDEEREARRHLDQLGEGYEQDSEDEDSEEEG